MTSEPTKRPLNHDEAMTCIVDTFSKKIHSYEEAILFYMRKRGFLRDGAADLAPPPENGDWSAEMVLPAVTRILEQHSAWIAEPHPEVALQIALAATIAVSNELTRGIELPATPPITLSDEITAERRRRLDQKARESLVRVAAQVLNEIDHFDAAEKGGSGCRKTTEGT